MQIDDCYVNYDSVPEDFPNPDAFGAVSGAQPKLLLVQHNGRYYAPGCSPTERYAAWKYCEDLANHLATRALESKTGKRSHMLEVEILEQYLPRLVATRWTSEPQARFIIRRVAQLLGWPAPPAAQP